MGMDIIAKVIYQPVIGITQDPQFSRPAPPHSGRWVANGRVAEWLAQAGGPQTLLVRRRKTHEISGLSGRSIFSGEKLNRLKHLLSWQLVVLGGERAVNDVGERGQGNRFLNQFTDAGIPQVFWRKVGTKAAGE